MDVTFKTPSSKSSRDTFGLLDPTALAQYDCFAVLVEYPETPGPNGCFDSNGNLIIRPAEVLGSAPPNTFLNGSLIAGENRKVMAVGFRSNQAACPTLEGLNINSISSNLSAPFEVALEIVELNPGEGREINLFAAHDGNHRISGCDGPQLPWGATGGALGAPLTVHYPLVEPIYPTGINVTTPAPIVSGGEATFFSVTPALPANLAIDSSTGVISGTAVGANAATNYTITASNTLGQAQTTLNIETKLAANMFVVNTNAHTGSIGEDDNCDDNVDGSCSLRTALEENQGGVEKDIFIPNSVGDISFTSKHTITQTNAFSIVGESQGVVVKAIANANKFLLFNLAIFEVSLRNLTIKDFGSTASAGGALEAFSDGTVIVKNVKFDNNMGIGRDGGAIATGGNANNLLVTRCTFDSNSTTAGFSGGAINIGLNTVLTVTDSTFLSNTSDGTGGAIFLNGANTKVHEIERNYFFGNVGNLGGGAIHIAAAGTETVDIINNTFDSNQSVSTQGGGAILVPSTQAYTINIINNTFVNNSTGVADAGGAIDMLGAQTVSKSLINNVFVGNTANGVADSCRTTTNQQWPSGGGNIFDNAGDLADTQCLDIGVQVTDQVDTSIVLPAVDDNGGFTKTIQIDATLSPFEGGGPGNCPNTDQRGINRVNTCDSGAFEVVP